MQIAIRPLLAGLAGLAAAAALTPATAQRYGGGYGGFHGGGYGYRGGYGFAGGYGYRGGYGYHGGYYGRPYGYPVFGYGGYAPYVVRPYYVPPPVVYAPPVVYRPPVVYAPPVAYAPVRRPVRHVVAARPPIPCTCVPAAAPAALALPAAPALPPAPGPAIPRHDVYPPEAQQPPVKGLGD